ncbi:MAG TPA: ATP-binding cassette domain-containing protein, partial [Candidatus Binatia bacterium]|nr:ATP-binding cassette domain-containing protein [Candidatus Binatia bacterium]
MTPLLEVDDLTVHFATDAGVVQAVDGASFAIEAGEVLGLVGESGSGKSVTALALLRLVPPPGRIVRGTIRFEGRDLLALPEDAIRAIRGARIAMVFQSPRTALNPVLTVGLQIARLYRLHHGASRA